MIIFLLFWTFFKIGAFSFGGGNAMIALIQQELEAQGWMTASEFGDVIAISQITPGPIAVNAATYVGVKTGGILGSIAATSGVSIPSFILIVFVAHFFAKFKESRAIQAILQAIKPVTVGMIASAVIVMANTSIMKSEISFENICNILTGKVVGLSNIVNIDITAMAIFVVSLISAGRFKLHPIWTVIISAFLGVLFIQI